jgi:hypothetical protein
MLILNQLPSEMRQGLQGLWRQKICWFLKILNLCFLFQWANLFFRVTYSLFPCLEAPKAKFVAICQLLNRPGCPHGILPPACFGWLASFVDFAAHAARRRASGSPALLFW